MVDPIFEITNPNFRYEAGICRYHPLNFTSTPVENLGEKNYQQNCRVWYKIGLTTEPDTEFLSFNRLNGEYLQFHICFE